MVAKSFRAIIEYSIIFVYYYNADGVIQNNVKALAWVCAAYANGDNEATKAMRVIKQKMTSTQIEQALKLAENYANGIFDENKKSKFQQNR